MSYLLFLSLFTAFSSVYAHIGHHQSRERLDGIIMTLDAHIVTSLNSEQQQMHGMFTGGLLTHHFTSESYDFSTVGAIHAAYEEKDDDDDDDDDDKDGDDDDNKSNYVSRNESSTSRRLTHLRTHMSSYAAMSSSTPINTGDWSAHPLLATKVSTGFKSTIVTDSKRSWDGINYGTNGINQDPSDPAGAAGTTQYVHMVNSNIIIYDKVTGAILVPAKKTIEYWPSTGICGTTTQGDGTVLFDRIAHRWILSHFAYDGTNSYHCLAISYTDDARMSSGYYYYAIKHSNEFADYPKVSIFGSSYVITSVAYTAKHGGTFLNSKVCALDRDKMVIGTPLTGSSGVICSYGLTNTGGNQAEFHFVATDVDSPTGPAPNSPIYLVSATGYAKEIRIYAFQVDFVAKTGILSLHTTVTSSVGQVRPCSQSLSSTGACVGSPAVDVTSTSTNNINGYTMDALADYTMYRIAYRYNSVTGVQTMLVVNNMEVAYQKNSNFAIIGTRWTELRATSITAGSWSIYQQGQIPDPFRSAFDYQSCWTGSIAMDRVGNIAIGCTASGHIISSDATPIKYYPNVQVSFRPNTRTTLNAVDSPIQIQAGGASYVNNQQRWGDYSMMTVDPVDDCRFWYATQYIPGGQTATAWRSYITSFIINGCDPTSSPAMNPPNPPFAIPDAPGTATQTNALIPSITGDPQFIGFHGQSYQVHGIPGMYFNILTSKYMQCNAKFEYLGTRPIIRLNHTSTTGWTHPGTYITNLAIKIGSHRLLITSGDAHKGWSMVGINRHRIPLGMKLPLNVTVDGYDGEQSIHYLSSHQIILNFAQIIMILHQSEGFINYQAKVTKFGWDSTKSIAPMHGLLGQTWEKKIYHTTFRYIEGTSDDYAVTSPFGNDFVFNRFPDDIPKSFIYNQHVITAHVGNH